jgi:hypothetical protein
MLFTILVIVARSRIPQLKDGLSTLAIRSCAFSGEGPMPSMGSAHARHFELRFWRFCH